MTLNAIPSHPSSLCYMLKLHRDSQPAQGRIWGLLEHVCTGRTTPFADAQTLVAALLAHAATDAAQARGDASGDDVVARSGTSASISAPPPASE